MPESASPEHANGKAAPVLLLLGRVIRYQLKTGRPGSFAPNRAAHSVEIFSSFFGLIPFQQLDGLIVIKKSNDLGFGILNRELMFLVDLAFAMGHRAELARLPDSLRFGSRDPERE